MRGEINPQRQSNNIEYFRKDTTAQDSQRRCIEIEINKVKQVQFKKFLHSFRCIQQCYIFLECFFYNFSKDLILMMSVCQIKEVQTYCDFTHNQFHYYIFNGYRPDTNKSDQKKILLWGCKKAKREMPQLSQELIEVRRFHQRSLRVHCGKATF